MAICKVSTCLRPTFGLKDYCTPHYIRLKRHNDLQEDIPIRNGKLKDLSAREREVAKLLALGKMNKEVADALGVSMKTIEKHRLSIYAKWNITCGFAQIFLAKQAIKRNVITMEEFLA